MKKLTTVRLAIGKEKFEILVHPDAALQYKLGKPVDIYKVVAIEEIYHDAGKGLRAPDEKLRKSFGSAKRIEIIAQILKRGELQLTSEQRRELIEEKRRQLVNIIFKNYVDPKTELPHPVVRIEQALAEAKPSIDIFKPIEEQAPPIIEKLKAVLPLKVLVVKMRVKLKPEYAPKGLSFLRSSVKVLEEKVLGDGSYVLDVEVPAGMKVTIMERINSITRGTAEISVPSVK